MGGQYAAFGKVARPPAPPPLSLPAAAMQCSRGLAGHDAGHVRPRAPRRDHQARRGLQVADRAQLPARRQEATERLVCLGPPGDAPGRRPRDHQLTGLTRRGDKPPATGSRAQRGGASAARAPMSLSWLSAARPSTGNWRVARWRGGAPRSGAGWELPHDTGDARDPSR